MQATIAVTALFVGEDRVAVEPPPRSQGGVRVRYVGASPSLGVSLPAMIIGEGMQV